MSTPDPFGGSAMDVDGSALYGGGGYPMPNLAGTNPGKGPDFTRLNQLDADEQAIAQQKERDVLADRAERDKQGAAEDRTESQLQDLHAERIKSLEQQEQTLEQAQSWAPQDHLQYVFRNAPLFLLATAFSSGITRKASVGALSSLNGMVQGMQQGSKEAYDKANEAFQQQMKTLQEKWALRDKVYDEMESAYGDSLKGQQRRWQIANAAIENDQASADKSFTNRREILTAEARIQEQYAVRKQAANAVNPAEVSQLVDAVGNYKQAITTVPAKMRGMVEAGVQAKYPNYSQMNYPIMQHAALYWSGSGGGQKQIDSFNVATGHLEQVEELGDALRNRDSRTVNSLVNMFKQQFNDPTLGSYEAIKGAVADEVVNIVTGGKSALADRQAEVANFVNTTDAQALHAIIQGYSGLMGERLSDLEIHYRSDFMGNPTVPFQQRLSPSAARAYERFNATHGTVGTSKPPTPTYWDAQGNPKQAPQ